MARWVRRRLLHRRPRQTTHDVDDGSQIGPLLDQITDSLVSFTGDGAYDQAGVYDTVAKHHPEADVIVPLRSSAVPGKVAETTPTQRDRHLQSTAQYGRMGWQKRSRYNRSRALVEPKARALGDVASPIERTNAAPVDPCNMAWRLRRRLERGRTERRRQHDGVPSRRALIRPLRASSASKPTGENGSRMQPKSTVLPDELRLRLEREACQPRGRHPAAHRHALFRLPD